MTLWGHGNERWGEHTIEFDCVSFVPNPIKSVELWIRHYTGYCCKAFHKKIGSGWAKINLVLVWIRRVAEIKVNCKPIQMHARTMLTIVIIWNVSFIELICLFVCLHTSSTSIIYKKYGSEAFYWSSIDSFNNIFLFLTVAHENCILTEIPRIMRILELKFIPNYVAYKQVLWHAVLFSALL